MENIVNKYKIIIPSYNSEKWIKKTLDSVVCQSYKNYDVTIIDDCSTDANQRDIIESYCLKFSTNSNKWKFIFNKDRKYSLYNIVNGIYSSSCKDEDVIIILDGDDWFYNNDVLNKVNNCYIKNDIYMTYGQYIYYPNNQQGHCSEVCREIIDSKQQRNIDWVFSHLKTFKFKLFKNIKREDFLDTNGKFMKRTGDLAIMYPIAEMAGHKIKFISDILYVYNIETLLNDFKIDSKEQCRLTVLIKNKNKYDVIV